MKLTNNISKNRYELALDDAVAIADYQLDNTRLTINRVYVPEALRGQGVAAKLMDAIVQEADKAGLLIYPVCSYAAAYMKKKKQEPV